MVEQEGHGVREDLAQQSACQMPEVLGPHSLHGITLRELREDGVDAVTKAAQEGTSFAERVVLLAPVRREELDTCTLGQLFPGLGRPVVAISDGQPASSGLEKLWHDGKLMGIGRSHREAADDPRPANPYVYPKAVEGLLEEDVLAESGFPFEAGAAVGAGKETRRQGKSVADGEGRVVGSKRKELLPEVFLYLPEVGRLPSEGSAVHLTEGREPLAVVAAEEEVDALVGVHPEELANDLDGVRTSESESLGAGPR